MKTQSLVALIGVRSVEGSIDFYAKLGFEVINTHADGPHLAWAALRSEGAQLMLARSQDAPPPASERVLFYVYCHDVEAARASLMASGVTCGEITHPFYSPRGEFEVHDPDGFLLMVSHT